jgi:hypothetical protein
MPRTRSASAHRRVIEAALELIGENGVDSTSMDAIAGRSGVSKATIYKHWADKDALLLELISILRASTPGPGSTRAIPAPKCWPCCAIVLPTITLSGKGPCPTSSHIPPGISSLELPGDVW